MNELLFKEINKRMNNKKMEFLEHCKYRRYGR